MEPQHTASERVRELAFRLVVGVRAGKVFGFFFLLLRILFFCGWESVLTFPLCVLFRDGLDLVEERRECEKIIGFLR